MVKDYFKNEPSLEFEYKEAQKTKGIVRKTFFRSLLEQKVIANWA